MSINMIMTSNAEIPFENPCLNYGTAELTNTGIICSCVAGFTGALCETGEYVTIRTVAHKHSYTQPCPEKK